MTILIALCFMLDWPEYRGPHGNGHPSADAPVATAWGESQNVLWKVAVPGVGWSSPVAADGRVWVTTSTPDGKTRSIVAVELATGKTLHAIDLFAVNDPPDIRQFNSYATPTPAIASGKVVAHFGSAGTACLDAATGKVLWKRDDLPCDHWRGAASSPVVHADRVYLQFDGYDLQYVVTLDLATGKTLWRHDRTLPYPDNGDLKKAFATPAVITVEGRGQLITSAAVGTVALDPATGRELWRVVHGGMNEACRPVYHDGLLYLTAGHVQQLWAVRPTATSVAVEWKFTKEAPTRPSPIVVGAELYAVNDKGVVTCLDAKTGRVRWQDRLNETVSASPIYVGGHLYVFGERGRGFVIRPDPEGLDLVATNELPDGCRASPAAVGGTLLVRTTGALYAITKKSP